MVSSRWSALFAVIVLAVAVSGCWKYAPDHCTSGAMCASGVCDMRTMGCVPIDGGADHPRSDGPSGADQTGVQPDVGRPDGQPMSGCSTSKDCPDSPRSVCEVPTGLCVGCLKSTDCTSGGNLVCDTTAKTCVACLMNADCTGISTPVCNSTSKTCVGCLQSTDCKTVAAPVCDVAVKACRGCGSGADCLSLAATKPVCLPAGSCVECSKHAECGLATKPICDAVMNVCKACANGAECAVKNAATPACAPSGKCVECASNADCKAATKPTCDLGTNTCRACQADTECTGGPQVCMKHQDGRCATDAETIYVQKTAGCPGAAATADGTAAKPYCSMDPAVAAVGTARDVVLVRGAVTSAASGLSGGSQQISLVGQMNASISGADPGLHVAAGDVYVRNVKLGPGASLGCQADAGSTVRLDRVLATGNSGGGILLNGAAFEIENTTVTNNGPGSFGVATWGGILVNNPPAAGPAKLHLVTVQSNLAPGISCSTSVSGSGVLASANPVSDISAICAFSSCTTASATCGAQP